MNRRPMIGGPTGWGPPRRGVGGGPTRGGGPERRLGVPVVVHRSDSYIVIDKPAGMLSASIREDSRETSAFDFVKRLIRNGRRGTRAWIIHRLDREVSGLMVFATSPEAYESLKDQLQSRGMQRTYLGVLHGEMPGAVGGKGEPRVIRSELIESVQGRVRIPAPGARVTGRTLSAITHYVPLAAKDGRTLVRVKLQTGRKHQIRVHMSHEGYPLVGDNLYGAAGNEPRIWLHAEELAFTDPDTGKAMRFKSPAPRQFYQAVGLEAPARVTPSVISPPEKAGSAPDESWEHVAEWYESLWESDRSDLFKETVLPGALRMLGLRAGERLLDAACGGGHVCEAAVLTGASVVGVDLSEALVGHARARCQGEFVVGDARDLVSAVGAAREGTFDAAVCVLALMNIEPMGPVFEGVARLLRPGGRLVVVLLHPAFRSPGATAWGWEGEGEASTQYRRVDAYMTARDVEIVMNPGKVAGGARPVKTHTFHRPLQEYVSAAVAAGLVVTGLEEWTSTRQSQAGPRAGAENRAREEIPVFLAARLEKVGVGAG